MMRITRGDPGTKSTKAIGARRFARLGVESELWALAGRDERGGAVVVGHVVAVRLDPGDVPMEAIRRKPVCGRFSAVSGSGAEAGTAHRVPPLGPSDTGMEEAANAGGGATVTHARKCS